MHEFIDTFDSHHNTSTGGVSDHIVTREEFDEYYNNIAASIDRDDYFELMMNNAWKINEGDREYAKAWSNTQGGGQTSTLSQSYGQFYNKDKTGGGIDRAKNYGYKGSPQKKSYPSTAFQTSSRSYGVPGASPSKAAPFATTGSRGAVYNAAPLSSY